MIIENKKEDSQMAIKTLGEEWADKTLGEQWAQEAKENPSSKPSSVLDFTHETCYLRNEPTRKPGSKIDLSNPNETWRVFFSNTAADLMQIQRCFAGEDVFQHLLKEVLQYHAAKRRGKPATKINSATVENVMRGWDAEEMLSQEQIEAEWFETQAYKVVDAAEKTGMHPDEIIAIAQQEYEHGVEYEDSKFNVEFFMTDEKAIAAGFKHEGE